MLKVERSAGILVFLTVFLYAGQIDSIAQVTGDLRTVSFHSAVFENTRLLRIWLPPGYDELSSAGRRYPVLFLNDGQNLFDRTTSQFSDHEWEVDESASRLIRGGEIPEIVVVGIDNAGKEFRPGEYLPWEDVFLVPRIPEPQGSKYPAFLIEEVVPYVTRHFRVRTDPEGMGLGGSSYGSLISLFTVTRRPGKFGLLLLESPSLYVNDAQVLKDCEHLTEWPPRIYIGVGTHEGRSSCDEEPNIEAVQDVQLLEQILRRNAPRARVHTTVEHCGLHNEEAYARRFSGALRFLFDDPDAEKSTDH